MDICAKDMSANRLLNFSASAISLFGMHTNVAILAYHRQIQQGPKLGHAPRSFMKLKISLAVNVAEHAASQAMTCVLTVKPENARNCSDVGLLYPCCGSQILISHDQLQK